MQLILVHWALTQRWDEQTLYLLRLFKKARSYSSSSGYHAADIDVDDASFVRQNAADRQ